MDAVNPGRTETIDMLYAADSINDLSTDLWKHTLEFTRNIQPNDDECLTCHTRNQRIVKRT